MLKINDVSKYFGNIKVLDHVSFSAKEDNIIGLAGPSGGGKSTLLRCIQGIEKVDSGSIEYNGLAGFMFQDFQLFPHMTVIENLVYSPNLKDKKSADNMERACKMLNNLGIIDKKNIYPVNLSGGQKQRVALARSLMMNPDLLLCDEPTSGLDVATTQDVITLLESVKDRGVTMIIASHDLDFLTNIADRILVLKHGKISVDVNPKDLVNPLESLRKYYEE